MMKFKLKYGGVNRGFSPFVVAILFVALFSLLATDLMADGLPGEYYVTQRWRDLMSGHSPAINPAFMTEENYVSIRGAISPTLQASFLLGEVGVTVPLGLYMSVGATVLGVTTNEKTPVTVWDGTTNSIVETGESYQDKHGLYLLSFAMNPWNRLSFGANLNIYKNANFGNTILGMGLDIGLTYRILHHSLLGDHILGLAFQNVISPAFKNGNGKANNNSADLKVSWNSKIWDKRIDFGIDIDIKDILAQAGEFGATAITSGGDAKAAAKTIEFDFNSRLGFWFMRLFNLYLQAGSSYWGVAGGINAPTINGGRDLMIDYQYMKVTTGDITSSHTIYFRGDFGKHREEVYARRMARLASIGPGNLYNKARTLYSQGNYWDAFFIFGRIMTEYPDFFKNDWVRLYLGLCQEKMDMREFSMENFNETKKSYPQSVVVPLADLGLMRLSYRDKNYEGVENQFALLNTSSVPDSIKYHAYYYEGEKLIATGEYEKAIRYLGLIPESHPEYAFAQHSLAVAYALNNNVAAALEALDNVVQYVPKNDLEREIINRSFLFLGFIYYEGMGGQERALSKAVSALRKVPANSYYFEDATLGLAWTALKASQWTDCVAAAKQLESVTKDDVLKAEAALLQAYCAMMDKNYAQAVSILRPASELAASLMAPSDNEKSSAELEYDNDRGEYYEIASKANDLAYSSQSSFVVQQIDSLHTFQKKEETKLRKYYKFVDEFARRGFFARRIEDVRNDIDYALAKAEKLAGTTSATKQIEKVKEKSEEIDQEMLKIQKQLQELDQSGGTE